jgi:hypothetical protein
MKIYLIKTAEVCPLSNSQMAKDMPSAKGAFTDIVVPSRNKIEANTKAKEAMFNNGYTMIGFEKIIDFDEFVWEDEDLEIEFKAMAWDAFSKGLVGNGPFYCWDEDEEKKE